MSDMKMYNILGKFNTLNPQLTKVSEKEIDQPIKEEVDPKSLKGHIQQLEEKYMGFKKTVAAIKKGGSAEDPEAVAASIGRKKYGKEKFQKAAAAGKKLGEAAKPDFLDLDKDGDRKEPMKKAAKEKKQVAEGQMKQMLHNDAERMSLKAFLDKHCHRSEDRKEMTDFWKNVNGEGDLNEVAPPGAKAERMVKHIKKGYAKDGKLTKREKGIAYATAWKAKKAGKLEESHDIRKHPIYTTQEAWDHYAQELAEQELANMEAESVMQEEPLMDAEHELDEIARLAGLPKTIDVDTKTPYPTGGVPADPSKAPPHEAPVVHEGETCVECGMMESECGCDHEPMDEGAEEMGEGNEFSGALAAARASGAKEFSVGGKSYKVKESQEPVTEDINLNVSATGPEDVLNVIQKLAGMPVIAVAAHDQMQEELEEDGPKERDIEYTNTPREETASPEAAYPGGTDLNRPKKSYSDKPFRGDNPMAVAEAKEEALWKAYKGMIGSVKE